MKKCGKCKEIKELLEFPMIKGKPYTYCITCKRNLQREWVKNKRMAEPSVKKKNKVSSLSNHPYLYKSNKSDYEENCVNY